MVTMRYDADGRRVELVTRPAGGSDTTTTFRYQGTSLAQELTGGTISRTYLTDESGTIVKVCDPDCSGSNPQYLPTWNGHGDALALWKIETTGALTLANSYSYSTWGTPTTATHNGFADPRFRFLYVGREGVAWDDFGFGLGLEYMQARHYSPALGRFLQPDPSSAEANLYAYAGNSPISLIDPSGSYALPPSGRKFCERKYGEILAYFTKIATRYLEQLRGSPARTAQHPRAYENLQRGLKNLLNQYDNQGCGDKFKQLPRGVYRAANKPFPAPRSGANMMALLGAGAGGFAAGGVGWWLAKLLAPACGPVAPACLAVL